MHDYQWALCDALLAIAKGEDNGLLEACCEKYDDPDALEKAREFARKRSDRIVHDYTEGEYA